MLDPRLPPNPSALGFLYARIDYERTPPPSAREFKLHTMRALLERLGNPQDGQSIVHIAGTKGKGSTAAMIASILRESGRRTACYTSPHLESIEERLSINGQSCSPAEFLELVDEVRRPVEDLDRLSDSAGVPGGGPTFFDIITAIALLHFARQNCDATVLEVGLGGRLDSTNVCQPAVSVITTISFDHTQQLGNTLAAIAGEKAGIIKPGVPVVSGVVPAEPREVIRETAQRLAAPLYALQDAFHYRERTEPVDALADGNPPRDTPDPVMPPAPTRIDYWELAPTIAPTNGLEVPPSNTRPRHWSNIDIALRGSHQALNAAVSIATAQRLDELGWNISESAIRRGLAHATCPARVEVVGHQPTVILDAAHNVASMEALLNTLQRDFPRQRRRCLFAVNRDKDVPGILQRLLPAFDQVVITQFHNSPRGVPHAELAALARQLAPPTTLVEETTNTHDGWHRVRDLASPNDLICCTGSFFLAAEVRALLNRG